MNNKELKLKLIELKKQLEEIVKEIQTERLESKEDESTVIDELLMNKSLIEKEIETIEEEIFEPNKKSNKTYIIKQNNETKEVKLVSENLADSSLSKSCKEALIRISFSSIVLSSFLPGAVIITFSAPFSKCFKQSSLFTNLPVDSITSFTP